ncbi:MAG: VanW family protein [Oscillospiraceae bacterium]|nr:VanW family protein [Oscillospiraceae bacterium]
MARQTASRRNTRRDSDELERSYRKVSSGGKYQKKRKKKGQKASAALTICIAMLVIAAIVVGCIYIYNNNQNGVIAEGVTLAGINVGGMTQAEAISAVTEATKDTYTKTPMAVKVLESEITIEPSVSKASLNVRAAVKAAFKQGKANEAIDISPYLNLDEDAIKDVLNELGVKYSSTLSQSTYEVTGTAPDQVLVVKLGVPEYGLDMNQLYQQVLAAYSANVFTTEGTCGLIEPQPIDLKAILDKHYIAPVDAVFDKTTQGIIEGVDGYGFDLEAAEKTLKEAAYGSAVNIPFVPIKPNITAATLSSTLYKDTLATWTATEQNSDADRNVNLKLACAAIDGVVVNPGDTFSYNNTLGERTVEKGYRYGPSIANGKTTETIGGGICQVSSALYYCVMQADLKISTRENHGFAVSYVPLGMDAAVSWGSLDFCFENTSSYPIRIEASADGGSVTVSLVGTDEKDYYVELEYEVLATYSYDTTYKTMSADNAEGYKNGDYITEPHTGYSIQTYRCKYDKETKELISKDPETASYYDKCDAVICVISGDSSDADQTPGIGNGGVTEA